MPNTATSSLSAVRIVERKADSENVQLALALKPISAPASVRIRQARQALEDLVLEDELETENGLLLSAVAYELNGILLELDQLAGQQRMFELWIQDAP
jgi:hypothetical protein